MKLIHLSDLHIGKRVNEFPMLEDQKYILNEILSIIGQEKPEAVLIAGDVYDKPVPPAEAVQVFDSFLTSLADCGVPVFVISGNHDSPERLAFGGKLMVGRGVHMAPVYDGHVEPVELRDAYGQCAGGCEQDHNSRSGRVSARQRTGTAFIYGQQGKAADQSKAPD